MTTTLDLRCRNPLPEWLPGESLFSLLSRFHLMSGNRLASDTCRALFGHSRAGCEHDFTTRLGELCRRTQSVIGEAQDIAISRTLLPFYLPLKSVAEGEAAIAALVDEPRGMLKFRLGIHTSRFRANHPLKACSGCMDEDRRSAGVPIWHCAHQLPGVWRCLKHRTYLLEASVKSTGVARFGWLLPDTALLHVVITDPKECTAPCLDRFALLTSAWARLSSGSLHPDRLAATYRAAVNQKYGSDALRARKRNGLGVAFCEAVSPLRLVPELRALPASEAEAAAQLQRWILAPRGGTHPLRHLAIIFWLFEDWTHFWRIYEASTEEAALPGCGDTPLEDMQDSREVKFLAAIKAGQAVSVAALRAGVSTNTGIAWATRHGFPVQHRPKAVTNDIRHRVIAMLRAGEGKVIAARQCDVSIQSVTRILQSEIGLRDAWQVAQRKRRLEAARQAWQDVLAKLDGLPAALIRCEAAAAYAWLYRNDRDWLVGHRPTPLACGDSNRARVDWDARDLSLSAEVRRAAAEIAAIDGHGRVRLWRLCQVLPELKAKLGALDRLPLTRKAIQQTTVRRRTAAKSPLL